jgi:hypothetical protein
MERVAVAQGVCWHPFGANEIGSKGYGGWWGILTGSCQKRAKPPLPCWIEGLPGVLIVYGTREGFEKVHIMQVFHIHNIVVRFFQIVIKPIQICLKPSVNVPYRQKGNTKLLTRANSLAIPRMVSVTASRSEDSPSVTTNNTMLFSSPLP